MSRLAKEAEDCRSRSDSEPELDPVAVPPAAPWWVHRLREHTNDCAFAAPTQQTRVVSACTGASAESSVLQAGLFRSCEVGF